MTPPPAPPVTRVSTSSEPAKWAKYWQGLKLFVGYFASQTLVQVLGLITGFIVIRMLSKEEYASYTIIYTLGPVMLMLSDMGIGTGLMSVGRHVWEDDREMGSLINTGLTLRRKFALFSFLIIGPFLAWMLYHKNVPIGTILLLSIATLIAVSFQISTAVLRMVLELRQSIKSLAKVSIASSILRLMLVGLFALVLHLNAFWATLATTIAVIFETYFATRAVKRQVVWDAPVKQEYLPEIYSKVRKTMPLTIYYCVQSQISIWLIGLFGNAHQVADIGSASRLSVMFATLVGSYSVITVPRFARNNGRSLLQMQALQIISVVLLMLIGTVAFIWLFPEPFIWMLGAKYSNMSGLLWLVVLSAGLGTVGGFVYGMNLSKGWIPPAQITIPIELVAQVSLLFVLDLSKTANVLIFALLGAVPPTLISFWFLIRNLRREPEDPTSRNPFSAGNKPVNPPEA